MQKKLSFADAVEIWIRRWLGHEKQQIIWDFEQNPLRIYEIWEEETFSGSRQTAEAKFRENFPQLVTKTDFSPHKKRRRVVARSMSADQFLLL